MKRVVFSFFLLVIVNSISAQKFQIAPSREDVNAPFSERDKIKFTDPDKLYYPETWFHFVDGNVEKEGITKDLQAIKDAGISGVQFFHGGNFGGSWKGVNDHVYCLSENWEDILRHTASEAKRLGLRFTMQNCPGWSMAGGPWIKKENAMRHLSYTRTDAKPSDSGVISVSLPILESVRDSSSDYRDIMVLAFPKNKYDTGNCLTPSYVKCDTAQETFFKIVSGEKARVTLPKERKSITLEIGFNEEVPLLSLILNSINSYNGAYSYELNSSIKVEAVGQEDGQLHTILSSSLPMGAWQENFPTLTYALNEIVSKKVFVTFDFSHDFSISKLNFLSAARKNNWEMEAGWVLRSIPYESEFPTQDRKWNIFPRSVRDVTKFMDKDGNFKWKPTQPRGGGDEWTILRIGHVNTKKRNSPAPKEATGWECDKLSPEGVDAQFGGYIGKYANGAVNGLLSGMLLDSWECETQTWTRDMESKFLAYTGYELRPWIPALFGYVIGDQRLTAKFLHDWKAHINYLMVNNFYGRMAENAKKNGLYVQYETSGGDVYPCDIMEYFKYADVPMAEFWHHSTSDNHVGSINFKPVRPTASAAHIYGKTRVSAEAFTSFWLTWNEHLSQLKENANRHFAQGITHLVFHTYTHNPKADSLVPGTSFGSAIGSPFLRGQTWWKFMPEFTKYLARCTYMLERGLPSMDVLWYLGDDIDHKPDQRKEYIRGYNYDYCNPDVLQNRLSVKNGKLVTPEGNTYKILWFPKSHVICAETVYRLLDLVTDGAILVTSRPKDMASLEDYDHDQLKKAMDELYGAIDSNEKVRRVGQGKVYLDADINDVLKAENINEDMVYENKLDWIHRTGDGADWYFVAAPEGSGYDGKVKFRNSGRTEMWDPVSASIEDITTSAEGEYTTVDLHLAQGECKFIVFNHKESPVKIHKEFTLATHNLSSGWTVTFPDGWGALKSLTMDTLIPWKDIDNVSDEGKSFSGTAVYTKQVDLHNYSYNKKYMLSLGDVDMIAKVIVNGKEFRPLWTLPYSVDITSALDNGVNTISIEVTSGWYNRLVYDARIPENERKTWTIRGPSEDSEYQRTGLMGPIILKEIR